jgi:hypothetical protein
MNFRRTETLPPFKLQAVFFILLAGMLGFAAERLMAQPAEEIEAGVYACPDRFYRQVKGGREMAAMAEGVLVMPAVIKAGLIKIVF